MTEKQKSNKVYQRERKCGKDDEAKVRQETQEGEKKKVNTWESKTAVTSQWCGREALRGIGGAGVLVKSTPLQRKWYANKTLGRYTANEGRYTLFSL